MLQGFHIFNHWSNAAQKIYSFAYIIQFSLNGEGEDMKKLEELEEMNELGGPI